MADHVQETRPAPERLLAEANVAERSTKRGRLKIFLGAAPGVGKTYTMLESARARMREGIDVLCGIVLTHGRAETEEFKRGLPEVPRVPREHRGITVEEFDLDAALARKPALILVDELAHTNAHGSRHEKRWQDVVELLDAGIDVYTTLNVQHLESVHDVVERLTGIPVRERVPDDFLDSADEIELVDLPTEELLVRLRLGKVYLGAQAERAAANFFKPATLSGLRELALRLVADRVRARTPVAAHGGATGRLLVAVSASPFSARLLRTARRMAESLQLEWLAVHVLASEGLALSEGGRRRLGNHLRLAEQLGGEVHTVSGRDVVAELVAFARRNDVRHIVVGKPLRSRFADRMAHSFIAELVRASGDIDVFVVHGQATETEFERGETRSRPDWLGYVLAILAVAFATAICWTLRARLAPVNLAMFYLLVVVSVAARGRRGPAILASLLSVAAFDFFFIPPCFAFTVSDSEYLLTFTAMLAVGMLVSGLSARLRAIIDSALRRAETSSALHRLSVDLASARGVTALVLAARRRCRDLLGVPVRVLVRESREGPLHEPVAELDAPPLGASELAVARWVADHGEPAGAGTTTIAGSTGLHLPLAGARGNVGVLVCQGLDASRFADPDERRLLESLAGVIGLALEGERLGALAQAAAIAVGSEQLKNALLSSVSHELRTPLQVITGSATALAESQALLDPETRAELARGIADEAESMSWLVTNLLDVSRMESGSVKLQTIPHAVEDLFGTALSAMQRRLADRPIEIEVAPECPPVSVDPVLFQSVLTNLLDNAARYTPRGSPLTLSVHSLAKDALQVEIVVADRGPGVASADLERIFEKFVRGPTQGPRGGAGLGLTICRRIIEAHGGTILARAREGGGAEFVITLPAAASLSHST